jgi:hypothetical protein
MVAMGVMQVAIHQIVNMVSVWHPLMPATRAMNVIRCVSCAGMVRRASIRIGVRHLNLVLINMILVRMMQVAIVQIINVTVVLNSRMTTIWAMLMRVVLMDIAAHLSLLGRQLCLWKVLTDSLFPDKRLIS